MITIPTIPNKQNDFLQMEEERVSGFWERVPEQHAARARALEIALKESLAATDSNYDHQDAMCMWCCSQSSVGLTKRHLQNEHAIQEPQVDIDFFLRTYKPRDTVIMYSRLYSKIPSKIAMVKSGKAFFAESF
ncbi:hypothetical protein C8Q80DRAFT_1185370 [Daedaleopsis nitida]|nr:hypothetical protein C8Q80DRAFT_1185370 [Daedaleopsis nitida]